MIAWASVRKALAAAVVYSIKRINPVEDLVCVVTSCDVALTQAVFSVGNLVFTASCWP